MEKLKLTALKLGATEVLTRAQLKTVLGGGGSGGTCSGTCYYVLDPNSTVVHQGTCSQVGMSCSCSGHSYC